MEKLLESILSINIMDEKDIDKSSGHDSCATSLNGTSQKLKMKQVATEIDRSLDHSAYYKDISDDDKQHFFMPKFFKMYLEKVSKGVKSDIKKLKKGEDDETTSTPAFKVEHSDEGI